MVEPNTKRRPIQFGLLFVFNTVHFISLSTYFEFESCKLGGGDESEYSKLSGGDTSLSLLQCQYSYNFIWLLHCSVSLKIVCILCEC